MADNEEPMLIEVHGPEEKAIRKQAGRYESAVTKRKAAKEEEIAERNKLVQLIRSRPDVKADEHGEINVQIAGVAVHIKSAESVKVSLADEQEEANDEPDEETKAEGEEQASRRRRPGVLSTK